MASAVNGESVVLEMSRAEADALARAIYLLDENTAAGAPIPTDDQELNELVGAIYQRLTDA